MHSIGAKIFLLMVLAGALAFPAEDTISDKPVSDSSEFKGADNAVTAGTVGTNAATGAMVSGGQLHNADTRAGLQNSLTQIGNGSQKLHDLVNKEGYNKGSATKEFLKYLSSFNPPPLSGIRKPGQGAVLPIVPNARPQTTMVLPPYQPKSDDETRWLSFLKKNGYEPTKVNLDFVMNTAKQVEKEIEEGTISSQPLVNWNSNAKANALDTIEIQADLQRIVDREKRAASQSAASLLISSVTHDRAAGEDPSRLVNDEGAEESATTEIIAPEAAEIILLKTIGDADEAQKILDDLKAEAGGDPVRFSKLFEEFQAKQLAKHNAKWPKASAKANQGIAKILGFALASERGATREVSSLQPGKSEATPSIAILALLACAFSACALAIGIYFNRRSHNYRKLNRQFVVRNEDPEWATSLKAKAAPVAAKSRKDNRKPREKKAS